jgi:hypothetical protein
MKNGITLLAVLFLLPEASAQEKSRLEVRSRVGDRVTVSEKSSTIGTLEMAMGEETTRMELSEKTIEVTVDEVLAVDEHGWNSRVRRTVRTKRETDMAPVGGEAEEEISPLEGKTFVIVQEGDETRYEEVPEGVEEADLKKFDLRRPVFVRFLPTGDVPIGTTWEIPEKELLEDFTKGRDDKEMKMSSGKATGTLKTIEEGIAVVVYEILVKGKTDKDMNATIEMTVTARIDSTKARILSLHGDGKMKMSGSMNQGERSMELKGTFTLKRIETYSYK